MNTLTAIAPELIATPTELTATAPDPLALATCPSCHTTDAAMTNEKLATGADWVCGRCGARWNATRLATAAAYAVWMSERTNAALRKS